MPLIHTGKPCLTSHDWPDALAAELAAYRPISIENWASANGLARETVSRGFAQAYGVPPSVFRAELRTRRALFQIVEGHASCPRSRTKTASRISRT